MTPMPSQQSLLDEIAVLLDTPSGDEASVYLARVEHTLTAGYARALALEAERWRLERQLGEQALAGDHSEELSRVAQEMSRTDGDLSQLRDVLATLRQRMDSVRASVAA